MTSIPSDRLPYPFQRSTEPGVRKNPEFLRRLLSQSPFLRSWCYLAPELFFLLLDSPKSWSGRFQATYMGPEDPWRYRVDPRETDRFAREIALLEDVRRGALFDRALEIGCAEGAFTEHLSALCTSLLAADLSEIALSRARARRPWRPHVHFQKLDLRRSTLGGPFDLIVVVEVLGYICNPHAMRMARAKLIHDLRPGGFLLLGNIRQSEIIEGSWWSRPLIRGASQIEAFFAGHPNLERVLSSSEGGYLETVFRKSDRRG